MKTPLNLILAALTTTSLLTLIPRAADAGAFTATEVDQSRFIAVASPFGTDARNYQLLILEQVSNKQPCWTESGANPTNVDPLLLNFDFTGICGRSTDSNGYSIRLGDEDLGWRYILSLVRRDNDMVLIATSTTDRKAPPMEIGRTNGLGEGFEKIVLNPGWRFTRRTLNGKLLGHIYLTGDLAAIASPTVPPAATGIPPIVQPPSATIPPNPVIQPPSATVIPNPVIQPPTTPIPPNPVIQPPTVLNNPNPLPAPPQRELIFTQPSETVTPPTDVSQPLTPPPAEDPIFTRPPSVAPTTVNPQPQNSRPTVPVLVVPTN